MKTRSTWIWATLCAGISIWLGPGAAAATFTWNNSGGGDFSVGSNWTPTGPPGSADSALIQLPGTYTVTISGSVTVGGIKMGDVTSFVLLSIQNGASLTLAGNDSGINQGSDINNAGTITFAADGLWQQGGSLPNASDVVVTNTGTIRKTAGTGESGFLLVALNSSGNVDAQTGSLLLGAIAGNYSGNLNAGTGAVVHFGGGVHNLNSGVTLTGGGTFRVNNFCDVVVNANVSVPRLELGNQGTIRGSGTLTVTQVFDWVDGVMSGAFTTTIAQAAVMNVNAATVQLTDRTLVNQGTVNHGQTGGSGFNLVGNATFDNRGLYNSTTDTSMNMLGTGTVVNSGTWRKSGGSGDSFVKDGELHNTGSIQAQTGTLVMQSPLTNTGSLSTSNGAAIQFVNYESTFNTGTSFTGGGLISTGEFGDLTFNVAASIPNLELGTRAKLQGPGTVTVPGTLTWLGANMIGPGITRIPASGTLILPANVQDSPDLDGRTLEVAGTMRNQLPSSTKNFNLLNGAVVNITGAYDSEADNRVTGGTINNSGVFRKILGTGVSDFQDVTFNNTGTFEAVTGTFGFIGTSTFTQTDGSTALSGGNVQSVNSLVVYGGIIIGNGKITGPVNNNALLAPGNSAGQIEIEGSYTQGDSGILDIELGGLASAQSDRIEVTGSVKLDGSLELSLIGAFTPVLGNTFTILVNDGTDPIEGRFAALQEGATLDLGQQHFRVSYVGGSGNDVTLTVVAQSVTVGALDGAGLGLLALLSLAGGAVALRRGGGNKR